MKGTFSKWLGQQEDTPETDAEFDSHVRIRGNGLTLGNLPSGQYTIRLTPEQMEDIARWQWMWKGFDQKTGNRASQPANP